ncbi:uncharacterized protein MKS88_000208 [Plasmodium brasilianum]|uniref:uncharacterized protein n=1 Tax=Plasmodium brasilianum TaxID=5824 RepID=UPI00350E4FED|nr:hypothetical protein MKS88_000208 [Plasmodium brasilianum]
MKRKFKLLFFIKIETFIFLTRMCQYFCKYLDEKEISDKKSCTRTYRLLAMHNKEMCLNSVWKKEDILNNGDYEKKHISNNKRVSKGKNKLRNECTSINSRAYKQAWKSKSSVYNSVNTYSGKRMLDKIYYKNVLVGVALAMLIYLLYDSLGSISTIDLLKYFGSLYILWIIVLVRLFYILRKTANHKELLHLKSKMNFTE